jgi:hypothetical protein
MTFPPELYAFFFFFPFLLPHLAYGFHHPAMSKISVNIDDPRVSRSDIASTRTARAIEIPALFLLQR